MGNETSPTKRFRHLRVTKPSPWIARFAPLVGNEGSVLDLACGNGRHGRLFLEHGCSVTFVDRHVDAVDDVRGTERATILEIDLEDGKPFPFADQSFDGIVVSNYLYRPHFPGLLSALADDGVLIYETFARGNETFSKPRNPDHLLCAGELLTAFGTDLQVVAYAHGISRNGPIPGVIQRLCAVKNLHRQRSEDHQPPPQELFP